MAKPHKKFQSEKPDGELRQSQLVTTFGPGAIMDLIDHTVVIGGLDFWHYDRGAGSVIADARLREALLERFRQIGIELSHEAFRKPPVARDQNNPHPGVGVPVLEFPSWFVCQNDQCRALIGSRSLETKKDRLWHRCDKGPSPSPAVPVRFVAACPHGHLQDFPWINFVHGDEGRGSCSPRLEMRQDATGDVSGIWVHCHCGAKASLSDALGGPQRRCEGKRPWLGADAQEQCGEHMRLLVRTASNAYFAQVVSALWIPEPGKELENAVKDQWETLKVATAETLPAFLTIPKVKASLGNYPQADILATIARLERGGGAARIPIRSAEFKQLTSAPPESPGDMPSSEDLFYARECKQEQRPTGAARVVLVPKLREVRTQVGFTRLEPVSPDLEGDFDLGVKSARMAIAADWLPAIEIQGEGIFLQLDEAAVRAWEDRPAVVQRGHQLRRAHAAALKNNPGAGKFYGTRYYMLHSLSHLLITAISLECGYSASAIRERIYCSASRTDPQPMAAILLSTGTSGSEGTLGGLVDQGRRVIEHLRRAFDLGRLCSNDPICASHNPEDDAVERYLEGAACHGCLFIAEPSCERYNRYLDRALVVPCLDHQDLAFLRERP